MSLTDDLLDEYNRKKKFSGLMKIKVFWMILWDRSYDIEV